MKTIFSIMLVISFSPLLLYAANVCTGARTTEIDKKYNYLLSMGINLGSPTSGYEDLGTKGYCRRLYEWGQIYSTTSPFRTNAIRGAISMKYKDLGEYSGYGFPLTDELTTSDGVGKYTVFENGNIYWSPNTGAHSVKGAILRKYIALNSGSPSLQNPPFLGYPISDEEKASDNRGRFNKFENGMIFFGWETDAFEVHGSILDRYLQLGDVRSYLGYPKSDELPDGKYTKHNVFEHGWIYWNDWAGARDTPRRVMNGIFYGEETPEVEFMMKWISEDMELPCYRRSAAHKGLYEVSLKLCGDAAHHRYGTSGVWCTEFVRYVYLHSTPLAMKNICFWLLCMSSTKNSAQMQMVFDHNSTKSGQVIPKNKITPQAFEPGDYLALDYGNHSGMAVARSFDDRFLYVAAGNIGDCVHFGRIESANPEIQAIGKLHPAFYDYIECKSVP